MSVEIDLHGLTRVEAIEKFVEFYNSRVNKGNKDCFCVIHGYGSTGTGGILLKSIRGLLSRYSEFLEFEPGEDNFSRNPGQTYVYPKRPLPNMLDMLAKQILDYCETPKTISKISGKFRRHGNIKILEALHTLEKAGLLKSEINGHYRVWSKIDYDYQK